jgi:hypothetical protein
MQIEGKKFFLQPSLGAKSGTVLVERPFIKKRFHDRGKVRGHKHTMQLRFESACILQLRKILVPSNPDHAKLIQAALDDRQGVANGPTAGTDQRVSHRYFCCYLAIGIGPDRFLPLVWD